MNDFWNDPEEDIGIPFCDDCGIAMDIDQTGVATCPECHKKIDPPSDPFDTEPVEDSVSQEELKKFFEEASKECRTSVHCSTCGWIKTDQVQFLNIEEDIQGRDVMTFKCQACGVERKSLVTA